MDAVVKSGHVMSTRAILTYDDYTALPGDGRRYEIHEGHLSVTPAPSPRHQKVIVNLLGILDRYVKAHGLGEVYVSPIDCILSPTTVVQPDIIYVGLDRLGSVSHRGIEGAATLAIEVLSASTADIDRRTKLQLYAKHGVPYYWMVDPDARVIDAYRAVADHYEPAGPLEGVTPGTLPPFPELPLEPAGLWS